MRNHINKQLAANSDITAAEIRCPSCGQTSRYKLAVHHDKALSLFGSFHAMCMRAQKLLVGMTLLAAFAVLLGYSMRALFTFIGTPDPDTNFAPEYRDFAVGAVLVPIVGVIIGLIFWRRFRVVIAYYCCSFCICCRKSAAPKTV